MPKSTKKPCAKTVLSLLKNPEKKTRLDHGRIEKLLKLLRDEYSHPEKMNEQTMDAFLKRQQVLDIFDSHESESTSAPRQHTMLSSENSESDIADLTQSQADIFSRIQKYPELTFPAHSTTPLTALKPGAPMHQRFKPLYFSQSTCLTYVFRTGADFNRSFFEFE